MKLYIENQKTKKVETLNISLENSKMGKIPSFSTPPVITCPYGVPCIRDCYARRNCEFREAVWFSYRENMLAIKRLPHERIVSAIASTINGKKWRVFRWNVGGDFSLKGYWGIAVKVAELCPNTQFLSFTKCYEVAEKPRPQNFKVVFSAWNNYQPPKGIQCPIAYFKDGSTEIPSHAKKCRGKCDECLKCFFMKPGSAVYFEKH